MAAKYQTNEKECSSCSLVTIDDPGTWQTTKLTIHKETGFMACGNPLEPIKRRRKKKS